MKRAIAEKDTKELQRLVQSEGVDLNALLLPGVLPLVLAASSADLGLCRVLVGLGASLKGDGLGRPSPLFNAISMGVTASVETLIWLGCDVNEENTMRDVCRFNKRIWRTPLVAAVLKQNFDIVKLLLDHGADINKADSTGNSPIHYCAQFENSSCSLDRILNIFRFRCHFNSGIEVNRRNDFGETPLIRAAMKKNSCAVQCLVKESADLNVEDERNFTALHYAVLNGSEDITLILLRAGCAVYRQSWKISPLCLAAGHNDFLLCDVLVEFGASVSQGFQTGRTLLHVAAHHGNLSMIDLALEAGDQVNVQDNLAVTPLMAARGNLPTVRYLVQQCRARLDLKDLYGRTALYYCNESTECFAYLIVEGIAGSERDYTHYSFAACKQYALKTLEFLMLTEKLLPKYFPLVANLPPDSDLSEKWKLLAAHPRSLKHFCRSVIRESLVEHAGGKGIMLYVDSLPLPSTLRNYIRHDEELNRMGLLPCLENLQDNEGDGECL